MMGINQILTLSGSLVPLIKMPKMTENMGSKALMMCVKLTAPAMATTAPTWPTVCSILSTVHALISSGVNFGVQPQRPERRKVKNANAQRRERNQHGVVQRIGELLVVDVVAHVERVPERDADDPCVVIASLKA